MASASTSTGRSAGERCLCHRASCVGVYEMLRLVLLESHTARGRFNRPSCGDGVLSRGLVYLLAQLGPLLANLHIVSVQRR